MVLYSHHVHFKCRMQAARVKPGVADALRTSHVEITQDIMFRKGEDQETVVPHHRLILGQGFGKMGLGMLNFRIDAMDQGVGYLYDQDQIAIGLPDIPDVSQLNLIMTIHLVRCCTKVVLKFKPVSQDLVGHIPAVQVV